MPIFNYDVTPFHLDVYIPTVKALFCQKEVSALRSCAHLSWDLRGSRSLRQSKLNTREVRKSETWTQSNICNPFCLPDRFSAAFLTPESHFVHDFNCTHFSKMSSGGSRGSRNRDLRCLATPLSVADVYDIASDIGKFNFIQRINYNTIAGIAVKCTFMPA